MTDPIRSALQRQQETKRALKNTDFVQAYLAGNAPSVTAFCTALDMGHEGDTALDAARTLDQAAQQFFANPPDDNPPAAA
jgi:hypothetical protein